MSITTPRSTPPYAMSSTQSVITSSAASGCGCSGTPACSCAVCQGLSSPARPRFFAGQVLTEVDLTALEQYGMNAHRMHNRYLHGYGVVCGLDLACEQCGDGIAVSPGYALDQCGRDLVVPGCQQVDVAKLIADCIAAERMAVPACDPPLAGAPAGCDTEQEWCLTLKYQEVPMRPQTPLASRPTASCGCGCSGSGSSSGCGCGCGGSATPTAGYSCTCGSAGSRSTTTCGCDSYVAAPDLPPGCEPTRIVECFSFGVCRCDGACCSLKSVLANTFPMKAFGCISAIRPVLTKRLSGSQQSALMGAAFGTVSNPEQTRAGICQLYDSVLELYQSDPCRTLCQLPPEFQQVDCTPRSHGENDQAYNQRITSGTQLLVQLIVAYVRDCLCHALNPPCPDGCEDRIVLGCFKFKDGKVTQICNLECRRYAGSFVSNRYWLPIGPMAMWALGALCCFPLTGLGTRGRGTPLNAWMDSADPTGELRKLLSQGDFALPKSWPAQARSAISAWRPSAIRGRYMPSAGAVNLATYQGVPAGDAEVSLTQAKVKVATVELNRPDELPVSRLGAVGVVEPGTAVTQYVYKGRVVGYGPALATARTAKGGKVAGG